MKISLNWLKDYVDIDLPPEQVADKLTMAGNEVGEIRIIGGWNMVVIGQIAEINPHPNADRLRLATVDLGTERQTVVCGAPNLNIGDKIVFASVGSELIDGHTGKKSVLKAAKIRGVASSGMVCSEMELGISESHEGILVLPPDAPLGMPLADYLGDVIFDLDITPNRPDCLSVVGIAREVAAMTGKSVHLPEASYEEAEPAIDSQVSVEILDPDLCPRYSASLITGVKIGKSPAWLEQRLLSYGMRPINNIVDITNFVMLEYGQPLHAFDYRRISDQKIIVRRALSGETMRTLDGTDRRLSPDMLVIADESGAVAVAGVMGGAESEISDTTDAILLEAASFNPASIHHTGSDLKLASEARTRFERGIRSELTMIALKRATQLIVKLGGGKAARGVIDVYPGSDREHKPLKLSLSRLKMLLGIDLVLEPVAGALKSLGFECRDGDSATELMVTAPYWRSDIRWDVDLIEEVARIMGYDKIPTTLLHQPIPARIPESMFNLKRRVRTALTGYGFQEVITYSLTAAETLNKLSEAEALRLFNPMSAEHEYLRPHLWGNLLTTLAANRKHEDGGIRIFELGRVYLPQRKDLPQEPETLCGILSGSRHEASWHGDGGTFDFYDARGVIEALLARLGINAEFVTGDNAALHPNKQLTVAAGGEKIGVVGEVHPGVLESFELSGTVCLFELNLPSLIKLCDGCQQYRPISRFPAVSRDIALVIDDAVTHQQLQSVIEGFNLVSRVKVFDVYAGKQVPSGKKSLAYQIIFQSPDHTLTDSEVDRIQRKILDKLSRELGATLRS